MIAKINYRNTNISYNSHIFAIFQKGFKTLVIVFNDLSTKFEVVRMYDNHPSIYRQVIVIDSNKSNDWEKSVITYRKRIINKKVTIEGYSWLVENQQLFIDIINDKQIDEKYILKAKKINQVINDNEWILINNEQDAQNLLTAAWGFHDATITRIKYDTTYSTYDDSTNKIEVFFESCWNCNITMIFSDVFTIKINRDSKYTREIMSASIFIEDGYIYWVDGYVSCASDITDEHDYIKAKCVSYKLDLFTNE